MKKIRFVLIILLSLFVSGCVRTRGYSGPELPPEQIATIRFGTGPSNIDLVRSVVDTIEANFLGIDMLPGLHDYLVDVSAKGAYTNCFAYKTVDFDDLNECLQKNAVCDCFEYLTVYKRCSFPLTYLTCEGDFQSAPGHRYEIEVENAARGIVTRVRDDETNRQLGEHSCIVTGQSSGQENLYQGTGRATAAANGFFYCP